MHPTQETRLAAFEGRQDLFPVAIEKLAAAGFCWTPFRESPAAVRCEDCEIIHKDWTDIPVDLDLVEFHRNLSPDCRSLPAQEHKNMLIDLTSTAPVVYTPHLLATCKELMSIFQSGPTIQAVKVEATTTKDVKQNNIELPSELPAERSLPDELKTCRRCDTIFDNRDLLFQHIYTNCGKNPEWCPNPFPCRICKDSFRMKHQLKSHLKVQHDIALWY